MIGKRITEKPQRQQLNLRYVCSWCGSDAVTRDAWAEWDVEGQQWVLAAVYDNGFCHRCEAERSLIGRPESGASAGRRLDAPLM